MTAPRNEWVEIGAVKYGPYVSIESAVIAACTAQRCRRVVRVRVDRDWHLIFEARVPLPRAVRAILDGGSND